MTVNLDQFETSFINVVVSIMTNNNESMKEYDNRDSL